MLRKDAGSVFHMLSIYLACFATGAMAVFFMGWLENLHQKERLDMIARKNMLSMETKGYCSREEIERMTEELLAAGFENPDFAGTTTEAVGYGEEIFLSIRAEISYFVFRNNGGLHRLKLTAPVSVQLSSTAKH